MIWFISSVFDIGLEICKVNVGFAIDDHVQFMWLKYGYQFMWDYFVDAVADVDYHFYDGSRAIMFYSVLLL